MEEDKEPKLTEFRSSAFHLRDFMKSVVWQDIKYLLLDMQEDIRNRMEVEKDMNEVCRFQGRADIVVAMFNIPQQILEALEEVRDEKEELPGQPDEFDLDD